MPLQITCSSCSEKLQIKDELAGQRFKCPKCGVILETKNNRPEIATSTEWHKPSPQGIRPPEIISPGNAGTIPPEDTFSYIRSDGSMQQEVFNPQFPKSIGRYRVEKLLGQGGFGIVYLANDEELRRWVAIKVPQAHRIKRSEDTDAYLVEAQILARLDHPHIVPVYDVGRSQDGLPFVVSKFIEGKNLADSIKEARLSIRESVVLVAKIAEALHYAHQQRLVHRDVKPGNILLDTNSNPILADFGLALKEDDLGKGSGLLGTPAYMSPEQASGEGHLVDGRSDIFSLGVVLYELLTGKRPFQADNTIELFRKITSLEPCLPRQIDPAIPKELERITLKALAKKASERYSNALDFADDLKHWLEPRTTADQGAIPTRVIPKGLRSFDVNDADFFLELLPGPCDRDGLPDSLRFWKKSIEEMDADQTFRVGVIYGPSGCGKSSFVKAGLLPRLSSKVRVVYIEATSDDTEVRLLKGIRKACPEINENLSLRDAVAHLRREEQLRQKVVIVLDQFEQWLHGKKQQDHAELVQALRQCDGERVQAVVMVRDDFWLAVSRFMKNLEIRIIEGQNAALVDLFDLHHAKKVLTAFGRAYGTLPENNVLSREQENFLDQAVSGLAQEGKVISVRLALFAEMVKGEPWTPATLKEVGGTEGIGVTFLEKTFSASTAPPEHRYHQKAARVVLKALLPEQGTDIKGQMRSHAELLEASGYAAHSQDFEDLLNILNSGVRLISPTDPEGQDDSRELDAVSSRNPDTQYYQLTHDYLVHSLRDWLTHKQKETRRGRAELLLADRAAVWNARPENRQLPSLWQWLQIRWFTARKIWTPTQKKMMSKAGQYHVAWLAVIALFLTVATFTGLIVRGQIVEQQRTIQAQGLVESLLNADTVQVQGIVAQMAEFRQWADPLLKDEYEKAATQSRQKLHTSLALLPVDSGQVDYLYGCLITAEPHEVPVIRDALVPHKDRLLEKLWEVVETSEKGKESQRLRAAAALAKYDPTSQKWTTVITQVVHDFIQDNPIFLGQWSVAFRPVRQVLFIPLSSIFKDRNPGKTAERMLASTLLADYAADDPQVLSDLLMEADENQFARLFPLMEKHSTEFLGRLGREISKQVKMETIQDKIIFEVKGTIGKDDPKVKPMQREAVVAKRYEVPLQGGKKYRFMMDSKELDPFLVLQEKSGKELGFDDDSGGDLNALLFFSPERDDTYLVYAASFKGTGSFQMMVLDEEAQERMLKRQANAAVALLRMNRPERIWPLLRHSPDPRLRSYIIHRFGPMGADSQLIIKRLDEEPDITIRRALIQSLGEFDINGLPPAARTSILAKLQKIYRTDADPGLHASTEWLLRQWKQEPWLKQVNEEWAKDQDQRNRRIQTIQDLVKKDRARMAPQWFVNGQNQTMVVIPGPVEFQMGSPRMEKDRRIDEIQHKKRLGRTFALAAKSVTNEQFQKFQKGYSVGEAKFHRMVDLPVVGIDWNRAVRYCIWLSKEEGIPEDHWCYDIQGKEISLKAGYLSLKGYRLPTEAEMEFATRAGALTARYYGETEELLPKYAWYIKSSQEQTWPVGILKPNDLGLFDTHGNVFTWCQENYQPYQGEEDKEFGLKIIATEDRILRGCSFNDLAGFIRSSTRVAAMPLYRNINIGFRPAKTFEP